MASIVYSQEQLVQGVTRQPSKHRPRGTCQEQINVFSSYMDGASIRHPLDWWVDTYVSAGTIPNSGDPLFHVIDKGPAEKYAVLFNYRNIQVYDLIRRKKVNVYNQSGSIEADFTYLSGFKTSTHDKFIVDQHTPEDLSNNMGSTAESPTSGSPDTTKSWKQTSSVASGVGSITPSYSSTGTDSSGPFVGKVATQLLEVAQSGTAAGTALHYYRFVATDEGGTASPSNKFPTAGKWRQWKIYVQQETSGTVNAPYIQPTIYNASTGQHHCAKFLFTGTALATTPSSTTGTVTATCTDLKNGWYEINIQHQSTFAEQSQECRVGFYWDGIDASWVTRRVLVSCVLLRDSEGSTLGNRFHKMQDFVKPLTIQDYTFFANPNVTVAMTATTAPAKSPAEEIYLWIKNAGSNAAYKVSLKSGTAKCKVGSIVYMSSTNIDPAAGTAGIGGETAVGGTPGDWASMNPATVECGGAGALQDYSKALYVANGTTPNQGMLRVQAPNTEMIALDMAYKLDASGYAYASGNRLGDGAGGTTIAANGVGNHGLRYFLTQANALKPFDATTITWPDNGNNIVEVSGSMIRLASSVAFDEVTTWDSFGGEGLRAIRSKVERISELPKNGPIKDGFRVRVKGDTESGTDDYFLKFTADQSGAFGNGVWSESTDYGVTTTLDATTMPHQLIRKQDNSSGSITGTAYEIYFEYGPLKRVDTGASWDTRLVGDDTLTPKPSFVGKQITNIFLWQGRLGLLTPSTVVLSEFNRFFNFWRTTAVTVVPDDPIDVTPDRVHGYPYIHAVPLGNALVLFDGKSALGVIAGSAGVRADAIRYKKFFEMESADSASPTVLERSIFVANTIGVSSDIREIYLSENGESAHALFPTEHVPNYIVGSMLQMSASPTSNIIMFVTDTSQRYLYCYKVAGEVGERTQEAFWKYDVGANSEVKGVAHIGEYYYLLIKRQYAYAIERMKVVSRLKDKDSTWLCRLDRRVNEDTPGFYKTLSGSDTLVTLPYRLDDGQTPICCNRSTGDLYTVSNITTVSGTSRFTVAGENLTNTNLWVGIPISWSYEVSPPLLYNPTPRGSSAQTSGRIDGHHALITYEDTYTFSSTPTSFGTASGPDLFLAPSHKSDVIATTKPYMDSGTFQAAVKSKPEALSLVLSGSDHRPASIIKIEFPSTFEQRAPRAQ